MTTLAGQSVVRHIQNGDGLAIRSILATRSINLDERNENGETFLMLASRCGELEIVKQLLSQSEIDVNAVDNDNWTALLNASREGHHEVTELLINSGALVEHKDMGGWTALMWACYKGKLKTCKVLLDAGANPNVKGEHHMSCVTWAAGRGFTEIVYLLLSRGAQVNTADKYGTTPLIWAARKGHKEIVDAVLNAGATVDVAGMYSWTALIVACKAGYTEVVHSLLEHHPNVNAGDKDGYTALTWAAKDGHVEIVNKLLQAGAYVNPPDRFGDTILIHAVKNSHLEVVKALLKKCADVDVEGVDNKTALYWSADKGSVAVTRALLEYNPNMEITNKDGDTALLRAVRNRNYDLVKVLLDKGAKISAQDKKGDTALHVAVRARSKRITELLLRNPKEGRLLYLPNKSGETPYQLDSQHERRLLTQVYGAQNLNADDNIQGYDLYSNTIADVLSEPSLHLPINVGLYAKWGSGKSFLISRLIRDMKDFTEHGTDPVFEFSWVLFLMVGIIAMAVGGILGGTVRWEVGVGVGCGLFLLQYFFLGLVYVGDSRRDWMWAEYTGDYLARKIQYISLLLQIIFCNEPEKASAETAAVKFLFTDNARLASVVGDKFITAMIGTLCESLEKEYGTLVTRIFKVMSPKPADVNGKFKSICCIPYFVIVLFVLALIVAIAFLLGIFGVKDLPSTVSSVLIGLGAIVVVALIINSITCGRMAVSIAVPAKRRIQRIAQSMDDTKIESHMQKLKREVELLGSMTRCMDAWRNTHTRLVVIVDGLDSCEQEKLVQVLDTVHMLFSDSGSPFVTILAVDPHVIIKGIEQNLHGLFRDSSINGHDYLRNIVQLPFFLQTQTVQRPRAFTREDASTDKLHATGTDRKFQRVESTMSTSIVSLDELKRKPSRKNRQSRATSQVEGGNLYRQASHVDLTKTLNKNTYFSDVNPRNMKRLMNIIAVTGRLLRANHFEMNWYKLAAWVNITEQWPYRLSWIILEVEDNDDMEDSLTLKNVYDMVQPKLPNHRDIDPLLEIDRNERKLEFFLTNHIPILTVGDLRRFLTCTIHVDPYLRKLIRELQQVAEMQNSMLSDVGGGTPYSMNKGGMQSAMSMDTPWPYSRRPGSRMDYPGRDSPQRPGTSTLGPMRAASGLRGTPFSPANTMMYQQPHPGYWHPPHAAYYQPSPAHMMMSPSPHPPAAGPSQQQQQPPQLQAPRHTVNVTDGLPNVKLSSLTVDEVASIVQRIDGLNKTHVKRYVEQLRTHNICGYVLLTCTLSELKTVLEMTFGDWELFRSVILQMRDLEHEVSGVGPVNDDDVFDNMNHNGKVSDNPQQFTRPVPPFNVDHKLYMPTAEMGAGQGLGQRRSSYSADEPRRKRHSSGGFRTPGQTTPQRLNSREQIAPQPLQMQPCTSGSRMAAIVEPGTPGGGGGGGASGGGAIGGSPVISYQPSNQHSAPLPPPVNSSQPSLRSMKRKDSFLADVMMESEFLNDVVDMSGVCSSSSDSEIIDETRIDLTLGGNRDNSRTDKPGYQSLFSSSVEEHAAKFLVGSVPHSTSAYQSSDSGDSEELEEITKETTQRSKSQQRKKSIKTKSDHANANGGLVRSALTSSGLMAGSVAGSPTKQMSIPTTPPDAVTGSCTGSKPRDIASTSNSKFKSMFQRSKDKVSEDGSQRTSIGSSILGGGNVAEMSDFQNEMAAMTPFSSMEHIALRKIAKTEDTAAPSAFKPVTPGSSRASSRASSVAGAYPPFSMPKEPMTATGKDDIPMDNIPIIRPRSPHLAPSSTSRDEQQWVTAPPSPSPSPSASTSSKAPKVPPSPLQLLDTLEDDATESGPSTPKSNASAEEIRVDIQGGRDESKDQKPDSNA